MLPNSIPCRRLRIVVVLLLAFRFPALAQETSALPPGLPDENAAETLLELELGDADVSFLGLGTWTTGVAPAVAWAFARDADDSLTADSGILFPGLEPIPYFNTANLTLSLWILNRYFFETTIPDDLREASILFGYNGLPGEPVQSVLVGNTAIGIGSYPYLGIGDGEGSIGEDAPGASALFATPSSEHELVVRFAPTAEESLTYAAGGVVEERLIAAIDYERDRHFVLPDAGIDFLEVFVEEADASLAGSDGRAYRRLDLAREAAVSLADGTLSLRFTPTTRVAIYYEKAGVSIGDATLGDASYFGLLDGAPDSATILDFSYAELDPGGTYRNLVDAAGSLPAAITRADAGFTTTISGNEAFVLVEPGRYSPFESASRYALQPSERVIIRDSTGTELDTTLIVRELDDGTVQIADPASDLRSFANRYPFASSLLDEPTSAIYGPAPAADPSAPQIADLSIRPSDSIVLPAGHLPGSVRVIRNGAVERSFRVLDSGELEFTRPLVVTDVVTVRYRTTDTAESAGLVVASGNRLRLAPGVEAHVAIGAQARPLGSSFSTVAGEFPGSVTLSAGVSLSSEAWDQRGPGSLDLQLNGAVTVATSDTSGALRVAGMNEGGTTLPVTEAGLFPSARPVVDPDGTGTGFDPDTDLGYDTRGTLTFTDFSTTTAFGERDLLAYNDSGVELPYEDGGRSGPYPARSFDEAYSGIVAAFDYTLDTAENWVAGTVRLPRTTDLSGLRELVIPYRVRSATGSVQLVLQIGATAEDLDGDLVLDEGTSGIPFFDQVRSITLNAGVQPDLGSIASEDANGNGVLDAEIPERVFSAPFSTPIDDATADIWREERITLTAEEASALTGTRSFRIIVLRDGIGARSGSVLVGSVTGAGADFAESVPTPTSARIRNRAESEITGQTLEEAFSQEAGQLSTDTEEQSVLVAEWSGLATGEIVLSRGTAVPASDYEHLRVYHRADEGSTLGATLRLTALSGSTIVSETSSVVGSYAWDVLELDLPETNSQLITEIELGISGTGDGTLLLDELSFWDPRTTLGAIADLTVDMESDRTLTVGGRTIVDQIGMSQSLLVQTESFPGSVSSASAGLETTTEGRARVTGISSSASLTTRVTDGITGLLMLHRLSGSPEFVPVSLRSSFQSGFGVLETGTAHAIALGLSVPVLGVSSADGGWSAIEDGGNLRREWSADVRNASPAEQSMRTLSLSLLLQELRLAQPLEGSYPKRWAGSLGRLLADGAPETRTTAYRLDGSVRGDRLGADAELGLRTNTDAGTNARKTDLVALLAVPLSLRQGEVTLSLERSLSLTTSGSPAETVVRDTSEAGSVLESFPFFFSEVPLWELFDPGYADRLPSSSEGASAANYEPAAELLVSRPVISSPLSLLVPTSGSVRLARPLERLEDSAFTSYLVDTTLSYIAPNTLGRLSERALFAFYDTDELVSTVRLLSTGGDGADWTHAVELNSRLRLLWTTGRILSFQLAGSAELPGGEPLDALSRLSYSWDSPADTAAAFPLPRTLRDRERTLSHESSLELEAFASGTRSVYARIEHRSTLDITELGSVALYGGLGLGDVRTSLSRSVLVGLRAGIEGRLRL